MAIVAASVDGFNLALWFSQGSAALFKDSSWIDLTCGIGGTQRGGRFGRLLLGARLFLGSNIFGLDAFVDFDNEPRQPGSRKRQADIRMCACELGVN